MIGRRAALGGMISACASRTALAPRATGTDIVLASVKAISGDRALAPLPGREEQSNIYDDALVVLVLLRAKKREDAGKILTALAAAQMPDGAIPFNVALTTEKLNPYIRSGALAWVGYAATEYLDGGRDGPNRERIVEMTHRIAGYLLRRRIREPGDLRADLVTGGRGMYRYDIVNRKLVETFVDGERDFVSIEHNVDVFFFLRALGRITERVDYLEAASTVGKALALRAWDEKAGQLLRGITQEKVDPVRALDGATWGGLMLLALGERARAERSFETAESIYASVSKGARGHKPYAEGYVIESYVLRNAIGGKFRTIDWRKFSCVWPEGSAGVAMLAARLGNSARAKEILSDLEVLRDKAGALPVATDEVPTELDTGPSLAGTAWFELVRRELDGAPGIWSL